MLEVHDPTLPPNPEEFRASDPASGRIIIIAPTRAACETIEIGLTLQIETFLEKNYGERVRELARSGAGFGIIAGTGTGKTLAVRPIAQEILRAPLKIGVVNREREAPPELPTWNVIIVTTGIARRWFQDGDILARDTLVVDEIHQTSAELELCLALGKRVGCRFIWLSATVDPSFYRRYLNSGDVLQVFDFDEKKAAQVVVRNAPPLDFLGAGFAGQIEKQNGGVGVFLPTRAGVEEVAGQFAERFPQINTAFYHGGEPVRAIRPFLEGDGAPKPFLLAMTAAGQSALNVRGLDTVVIEDARFANRIENGRNVLTRLPLGNNEMLQMAGRVHGRVEGGRVFILSERNIDFSRVRPTAPEFQLAGDSERVALTCADLGVRADALDLPVPLDKAAYRGALKTLEKRGIVNAAGRLTKYGRQVELLPVERKWAEMIVNAPPALVPFLAVMSSIESLHRMTRDEYDLDGLIVAGSDHLTSYNLYADAFAHAGFIGQVHGLPRHLFDGEAMEKWAESRGVLVKSIEDAALATACIFRALRLDLPPKMPLVSEKITRQFLELLARVLPFDLVCDEQTANGMEARVARGSVCAPGGFLAGDIRYFADRYGQTRASIEGTRIPWEVVKRHAKRESGAFFYDAHRPATPLLERQNLTFGGFILEHRENAIKDFPRGQEEAVRRALALALANQSAHHRAVAQNRGAIEELRELYRRSGGQTPKMGERELADLYEEKLAEQNVASLADFRAGDFQLELFSRVDDATRQRLWELPSRLEIEGREIPVFYDLEEENGEISPVARLELPEKIARSITENDLPQLDRPLRFQVSRGRLGALKAASLEELQTQLEGPWMPDYLREEKSNARGERSRDDAPKPRPRGAMGGFKPGKPKFRAYRKK